MLSNRNWVINIENAAAKVAAEYVQKVVDSVFYHYGAHNLEDLSPCYYSEVFSETQSKSPTIKGYTAALSKA